LLAAIVQNVFPLWLGLVLLLAIAITMPFRPGTDMRGGIAVDASGMVQVRALIVVNLTIIAWLMQAIFTQLYPL
jgi:hypothetical protein